MAEPGRPSELSDELTMQIRQRVLDGISYTQIQQELAIPVGTWDSWVWRDQDGFRGKLVSWKRERLFKRAEEKLGEFLDSDRPKVAQDTAKFLAETLGRHTYSRKSEVENTGTLTVNIVKYDPADNAAPQV